MHKCVVGALLLIVGTAAFAQPAPFVFGRERTLAPLEYGNASGQHTQAQVVTNGQDYLVVWTDHEGGPLSVARFTHEGVLLDRPAIGITSYMHGGTAIWTGTHYLIVWTEFWWWPNVYTRTLTSDGVLGEVHAVGIGETGTINLATNGNTVAIVFERATTLIVDPNGLQISKPLVAALYDRTESHVAAIDGGKYLIVSTAGPSYSSSKSVDVFTVDANGATTRRNVVAAVPDLRSSTLCANGDGALLVWSDGGIKTLQLNNDGSPAGEVRKIATLDRSPYRLALVSRGADLVLTFMQWNGGAAESAFMMRIDRDGNAIDAPARVIENGYYTGLSVAPRPDGTAAVAWVDDTYAVNATVVDTWPVAALHSTLSLALAARAQFDVRLASTSRGVAALWTEQEGVTDDIRLGVPDGPPITVWKSERLARTVSLLAIDDVLWAFWIDDVQYPNQSRLFVRRYTRTLRAIDREPLLLATGVSSPAVAAGDGVVLAAWTAFDPWDVHAAVLRPIEAAVSVAPLRLTDDDEEEAFVAVAWDGRSFTVGFTRAITEEGEDYELRALRVSARGQILDPPSALLVPAPFPSTAFSMVASRLGTAFVWSDGSTLSTLTFREGAATSARTIPLSPTSFFRITPMDDGFALLRQTPGYELVVDVLSATFVPRSSRVAMPATKAVMVPEDIIIHGGVPVIAYGRQTLAAPYGASWRSFIREARSTASH